MANTRTTKQLSNALAQIQAEAITRIGRLFLNKRYERVTFTTAQCLNIDYGHKYCKVYEIDNYGRVKYITMDDTGTHAECMLTELSADALLTILDEIERMKKAGHIKK